MLERTPKSGEGQMALSFLDDFSEAYKSHHIINDFLFPGSSKTAYSEL